MRAFGKRSRASRVRTGDRLQPVQVDLDRRSSTVHSSRTCANCAATARPILGSRRQVIRSDRWSSARRSRSPVFASTRNSAPVFGTGQFAHVKFVFEPNEVGAGSLLAQSSATLAPGVDGSRVGMTAATLTSSTRWCRSPPCSATETSSAPSASGARLSRCSSRNIGFFLPLGMMTHILRALRPRCEHRACACKPMFPLRAASSSSMPHRAVANRQWLVPFKQARRRAEIIDLLG